MTIDPSSVPVVEVDLRIEVDGPAGGTTAHVTGSGQDVRMWADRPDVVIATTGRRAGAGVTDVLAAAGLRAELHGPGGRVLAYDPGHDSRLGALLWGSRHVVVDRAGWPVLTRTAAGWARTAGRSRTAAVVGGLAVAGLAAAGVLAWRTRRDPTD